MNLYRILPQISQILDREDIKKLIDKYGLKLVSESVKESVGYIRGMISSNAGEVEVRKEIENLAFRINEKIRIKKSMNLRRLINAGGVILHTNLGRSLLPEEACESISSILNNYSNLEFDLDKGERGTRYSHVEEKLIRLCNAEAALVVNNNAAAVMLILDTLAKGKEVITSRGELIEIGGSFRIPDVCKRSGAVLCEVGCTNKTHLSDYEEAISENTAAILKVHTSNYKVVGFHESVSSRELLELKNKYGLVLIEDLGSGILLNLEDYGLTHEPTVLEAISDGVDVVSFSGDKLLGGPQAGIIVGKKEYIDKMKKNQLLRALRVDKMTVAALEAVLNIYLYNDNYVESIPTLKMITEDKSEVKKRAEALYEKLINKKDIEISIEESNAEVGGGSLPYRFIESYAVSISFIDKNLQKVEKKLRLLDIPIIARISKEKIIFDLRTVSQEEIPELAEGINKVLEDL